MLKLPPSRPPSPPVERMVPSVLTDARTLYDLLSALPRPSAEKERTRLAREAVDEAFDGLRAFIDLLELAHTNSLGKDTADLVKQLGDVTADLPTLVALPVLLNNYVFSDQSVPYRSIASMVGLSVEEYRQGCLTGYGRAEECTAAVGRKVLQSLEKEVVVTVSPHANAVKQWLEAQVAAVEL
ncbi:hypothetical protein EVG20_g4742 [Dentipellis fragilis]|uniref:Uncharacterized protein n=1 Tax=Dentipellis fragilis TaxID=205917 RepID=A0A4Y9YX78_9AGAM|nr:hypothetical protein EVG20_g4742 [Dentipellis fragilis]